MDAGSLLSAVITLALAAIGGLAWLFKLHGGLGIIRERLNGEIELRKTLSDRIDGFEQRIYAVLERIEAKIDGKADK